MSPNCTVPSPPPNEGPFSDWPTTLKRLPAAMEAVLLLRLASSGADTPLLKVLLGRASEPTMFEMIAVEKTGDLLARVILQTLAYAEPKTVTPQTVYGTVDSMRFRVSLEREQVSTGIFASSICIEQIHSGPVGRVTRRVTYACKELGGPAPTPDAALHQVWTLLHNMPKV
jgi:hypothetical protein